jgi:hypothetical protein
MSRDERVARNEALFREVNERIRQVNESMDAGSEVDFLCECPDPACTQPVSLTLTEYEGIRSDPKHFAVLPGHSDPSIERVIAGGDRFSVVEKVEPEAAQVAVQEDPRG